MKHLGDITKIHGDKIEPVDCITFGSPCQDLSIAGRRAGLAGERSGLFREAVRVIKEMRSSTNGLYPTFAVWENVPGAFSSNGGEDFRAVLEELARVEQPNAVIPGPPRGGRWSKAGAIAGNGWSLAWRQLDAQYWGKTIYDGRTGSVLRMGTPQRRKRIALFADFRGQRAAEILFERTSVSRNPDPCVKAWKEASGLATNCPAGNGRNPAQPVVLESNQIHATITQTGICSTLPASMGMGGGYVPMVTERKIFDARGNGDGQIVPTITGDHESRITDYTAIAVDLYNGAVTGDTATSITCRSIASHSGPQVMESYGIGSGQAHASVTKEKSGTLDTMHDAQAVAIEYSGCLNPWDTQARRIYGEDGAFPALPSRRTAGGNQQAVLAGQRTRWIVRRLTPTECERLQGYPDGWTDIGEWTDTKGKKHKPADSPRYKALGNSIALPQWFWIAQKMKSYMGDGAKLGSLFDGIGGFPLVWETTYGAGTAAWASEIEEFPMAVTKRRFGEE